MNLIGAMIRSPDHAAGAGESANSFFQPRFHFTHIMARKDKTALVTTVTNCIRNSKMKAPAFRPGLLRGPHDSIDQLIFAARGTSWEISRPA
jgi:hypothetical protein